MSLWFEFSFISSPLQPKKEITPPKKGTPILLFPFADELVWKNSSPGLLKHTSMIRACQLSLEDAWALHSHR